MLSNVTFDRAAALAGCDSATNFVVADRTGSAGRYQGSMVLQAWALLNASGIDMRPYTMPQVQEWYEYYLSRDMFDVFYDMEEKIIRDCQAQYCSKLPYSGNPDLGGIGVFTAYCIEIGLAGLFLVGTFIMSLVKRTYPKSQISKNNIPAALQSALCVFWDSSLLFSIGISIAALALDPQNDSVYNGRFMQPVTFTALMVPAVLWNANSKVCSMRFYRRAALNLAILLEMLAMMWMPGILVSDADSDEFQSSCVQEFSEIEQGAWLGIVFAQWGFWGLWFLNGVITLFNFPWSSKPRLKYHFSRRIRKALLLMLAPSYNPVRARHKKPEGGRKTIAAVLDHGMTLVLLAGLCFSFRNYVVARDNFNATSQGRRDQQQWGFGQVLAVTAWIPTFLEVYAVGKGAKMHWIT
ncbi:hypothetical protein NLG97_g3531 [Lecanicillium saksenae]|uniref:Uncharacterized protein n=1 Tax=Lecanicillium saksenae TaxID=468837 RepID=A0ACC1R153_9HYPO|nr:hypothetical protein NLG97_g3531 [Lecanicillium saksenae]